MNLTFYNEYHQGDCIYHTHFCNLILDRYPEVDNITNYFHQSYIDQSNDFVKDMYRNRIVNKSLDNRDEYKKHINSWINRDNMFNDWVVNPPNYFDDLYADVYNSIITECGLVSSFTGSDLLLDDISTDHFDKYDILLVNSIPHSGQWNYNGAEFDKFLFECKERDLNIITTAKSVAHPDIPTTTNSGYVTLYDIYKLSTKCDNIIGIHTSPFIVSVNKTSMVNASNIIALHKQGLKYRIDNYNVVSGNFSEVYNILGF